MAILCSVNSNMLLRQLSLTILEFLIVLLREILIISGTSIMYSISKNMTLTIMVYMIMRMHYNKK
jgi:hypothetical protein